MRLLFTFLIFAYSFSYAQRWMENDYLNAKDSSHPSYFEIKDAFDRYWEDKEDKKGKGYKPFARWIYNWKSLIDENGYPIDYLQEFDKYDKIKQQLRTTSSFNGNWQPLGPFASPPGSGRGIGRLNIVAVDPTDSNIVWVGSPSGGLWKSEDGARTWKNMNDDWPVLGVSDIAINPLNPKTIIVGSGDPGNQDNYSIGVMKTTDGGETWRRVHKFEYSLLFTTSRLKYHPTDTNILILTTKRGVFKSIDGGEFFGPRIPAVHFRDIEWHPTDPNIVYITTTNGKVYRSTNKGDTYKIVSSGLPSDGRRVELSVSPASPNSLYALVAASDGGLRGVYKSTNMGDNWTLLADSPDIVSGQGHYNLTIAVHPVDTTLIYAGGVPLYKSTNGGQNWTSARTMDSAQGFIHVDQHYLLWDPHNSNKLYVCNDGGLYIKYEGKGWNDFNTGLQITQYYKMAHSQGDTTKYIGGAQDNGTHFHAANNPLSTTQWAHVTGGDGMDNFMDPNNDDQYWTSSQNGNINYTVNGGSSFRSYRPSGETGAWVTPFTVNTNRTPYVFYAGYRNLWKREVKDGSSFTQISTGIGTTGNEITTVSLSESDSLMILISTGDKIHVTMNDGNTWSDITNDLPTNANLVSGIQVHPTNKDTIYVTLAGVIDGDKVFRTYDRGKNWENISGTIPNFPVRNLIYEKGSTEDGIYVGTDIGVFYRNNTMSDWEPFNFGLPNVSVRDFEILDSTRKLRIATYGRGIWESKMNAISTPDTSQPAGISTTKDLSKHIIIYPNPAKDNIYLDLSTFRYQDVDLAISNTKGEVFLQQKFTVSRNNFLYTLDVSNLVKGNYTLYLQHLSGKYGKNFVKIE